MKKGEITMIEKKRIRMTKNKKQGNDKITLNIWDMSVYRKCCLECFEYREKNTAKSSTTHNDTGWQRACGAFYFLNYIII